jgi:hypothetical protein
MACTREELKRRVESTSVNSNGRAMFRSELRRDVVEYSSAVRAGTGASLGEIAGELGLKGWTLQRWHQNAREAAGGASFVEVTAKKRGRPPKVNVTAPPADFEVRCPSGHEVKVPAGFEARALGELLAVLEGR